jgi:hypothetical protein
MGQYYHVVNLDKREYLHPHRMGDGLKLLEFGSSGDGTMLGLAVLLADGNGRGGGDLHSEHPIIGSWAGDRIVIAGDYADEGNYIAAEDITPEMVEQIRDDYGDEEKEVTHETITLYTLSCVSFREVSEEVRAALQGDQWCAENMRAGFGS